MDGVYEMAGSPTPVTIDGKTYLLGPLTAEDAGTIEQEILSERRKPADVLETLLPKLEPTQQRLLLEIAWTDEVRGPRVKHRDVLDWLSTKRGEIFRVWLLLRRNHPEITRDEAGRLYEHALDELGAVARSSGQELGNSSAPAPAGANQPIASPGDLSSAV